MRGLFAGLWVLGLSVGMSMGCASARHHHSPTVNTQVFGSARLAESYGPPMPLGVSDAQVSASAPYGPEPVQLRPIVLVLGPGLARGLSYAGVFRALGSHKIPVAAILGTEMGGVMAALYGISGNLNSFEWGFLRLKTEILAKPNGLFGKLAGQAGENRGDSAQLNQALKRIFQKTDLKNAKIPLRIAVSSKYQVQDQGEVRVLESGSTAAAVRAAIAVPGLFDSSEGWVAATQTRPFLVTEAKRLGLGPVVVINSGASLDSQLMQEELKQADLVISVRMDEIGLYDFNKRNEAALKGRDAVTEHLGEIRTLVGLGE